MVCALITKSIPITKEIVTQNSEVPKNMTGLLVFDSQRILSTFLRPAIGIYVAEPNEPERQEASNYNEITVKCISLAVNSAIKITCQYLRNQSSDLLSLIRRHAQTVHYVCIPFCLEH